MKSSGIGLLMFATLAALASVTALTCAQPECVAPDYRDPECRVIAENELARLDAANGAELRFIDPRGRSALDWEALGLLEEPIAGKLRARVATLGDFEIGIRGHDSRALVFDLELDNVDPAAILSLGPPGVEVDLPTSAEVLLRRRVSVEIAAGEELRLRGRRSCPERFQLAVVGDIQTNPLHFERIIERLREDSEAAAAAGEPILGMLLVGDLTEWSYDDEFTRIRSILGNSPVPVAVTPGNHDILRPSVSIYNNAFGPGSYAFEICGARVVMLDSGTASLARSIEGRLPELIARDGADFLIAATHYPPYSGLTGDGWSREDQPQILLGELALAQADLVVSGHVHALRDEPRVHVGSHDLRQLVVGTGGADQGLGVARFGYVRLGLRAGEEVQACFVEVPPPGYAGPVHEPLATLSYCESIP